MYKFTPKATGYLYSFRMGVFRVQKGSLLVRAYNPYAGRFYVNDHKFYQCSPKEGYLANSVVWLTERDDDRAKDIFIKYMEKKIAKARKDIEQYEANIATISAAMKKS